MIAVTLAIIKKLAISCASGDGAVTALTMPVSRAAKVSATSPNRRALGKLISFISHIGKNVNDFCQLLVSFSRRLLK